MINHSLFVFLNDLRVNNNREWFTSNKSRYQQERLSFVDFTHIVQESMHFDQVERVKHFRIFRDVRFSKNKNPYKTNFGSIFMREGAQNRGSYYLHIEPHQSFCAVGFYAPEKEDLYRIRKEFEQDGETFDQVNAQIGPFFSESLCGEELKTSPRGFDKDHEWNKYIRKKQFYYMHKFTNEEVMQDAFLDDLLFRFQSAIPFLNYMSDVLSTDENGESVV